MNVLETLFLQSVRMAVMALPVMAVVLALRLLLYRTPRRYSYALWAVVGFRLVCPVTLSLPVSIFNLRSLRPAAEQAASIGSGAFSAVTPPAPPAVTAPPVVNTAPLSPAIGAAGGPAAVTQAAGLSALTIAAIIWLAGVLLLLGWCLAGIFRLRRQVAQAVRQEADIWECDGLSTPFVLGLFRPRIYIPFHLSEEERRYVLAHERCHIRRRDYLVKPLALLILAVYWWNPAVWLCWVLFCRDMEMRCDEAVLEELGEQAKTGYSTSLLSFALDRRLPMAMAFGEHDAARRVKHVLDWKKARPVAAALAVLAVIAAVLACGTNAWALGKSRVEIAAADNGITFSADLHSSVQSWAIYEDVYEEGQLISSRLLIETGSESAVSWRPLSDCRIEILPDHITSGSEDDGAGILDCTLAVNGEFHYPLELPKEHYTGMGSFSGGSFAFNETARRPFFGVGRYEIDPDGEAVLYTVLLSTKTDGSVTVRRGQQETIAANDTVIQFRLVTSRSPGWFEEQPAGASGASGIEEAEIAPEDLLGLLPGRFMFSSGAGGWRTMLYLNADGSFTGEHTDSDIGSTAVCSFRGRLALPERVAPFTWSLKIEELTAEGVLGQVLYRNGIRYTNAGPYGLENTDELLLYLPGIATASLPEGFLNWARGWRWCLPDNESPFPSVFPFYGLYNPAEEQGFVAVTEDESYAVYVDFRTETVSHTASQLYTMKNAPLKSLVEDLACYDFWALTSHSENVGVTVDGGELSVTVTEPAAVLTREELIALAGNNAAMLLALREELTKIDWQVHSDESTIQVTLRRENENWLLEELGGSRSAFAEYGRSREGIQELIGSLEQSRPRFQVLITEPFHDILGYDGRVETETMGFWQIRTFRAETPEEAFPIAESFGFGEPVEWRVDLDGDGQEELVCNVTYSGDGARRAYVYQRREDGIYRGEPSTRDLPDFADWSVNSSWSEYDPVENVFRLHYYVDGEDDYAVLETHGLERMDFEPYDG